MMMYKENVLPADFADYIYEKYCNTDARYDKQWYLIDYNKLFLDPEDTLQTIIHLMSNPDLPFYKDRKCLKSRYARMNRMGPGSSLPLHVDEVRASVTLFFSKEWDNDNDGGAFVWYDNDNNATRYYPKYNSAAIIYNDDIAITELHGVEKIYNKDRYSLQMFFDIGTAEGINIGRVPDWVDLSEHSDLKTDEELTKARMQKMFSQGEDGLY